jgi:hypothetical protein
VGVDVFVRQGDCGLLHYRVCFFLAFDLGFHEEQEWSWGMARQLFRQRHVYFASVTMGFLAGLPPDLLFTRAGRVFDLITPPQGQAASTARSTETARAKCPPAGIMG